MEQQIVSAIRQRAKSHPALVIGIGDDCAITRVTPGKQLVTTTDMLMEGVDFLLASVDPALIGRKSLAVNLSDLAAMSADPVAAVISLALPQRGGAQLASQLYDGILPLAEEFGIAIAGGDTNSWDGPLVISITVWGEVEPGHAWLRDGGRAGDKLLVTGSLGGSIFSRQFTFTPRIKEAQQLRSSAKVTAAMDISDGLLIDLARLCAASNCGAALSLASIPIHADAHTLAAQDLPTASPAELITRALEHALGDGEDFELLLAMDPSDPLANATNNDSQTHMIGRLIEQPGIFAEAADGTLTPLPIRGYEHQFHA